MAEQLLVQVTGGRLLVSITVETAQGKMFKTDISCDELCNNVVVNRYDYETLHVFIYRQTSVYVCRTCSQPKLKEAASTTCLYLSSTL